MNQGINRVKKELLPQLKNCEVIISHQITDNKTKPEKKSMGKNVKYFYMYDKGLSKNRNNALKNATGDICVICDDDLNYVKGFDKIVKQAYKNNKSADVITFQAIDEEGNFHCKLKKSRKHNFYTILFINSWMITFKRKNAIDNNLTFDENYGLGAEICVGEENIFLKDAFDKKLNLIHNKNPIVVHPDESSGINYRAELIKSRPLVFKRMYGLLGYLFALVYFPIFHYKLYKEKYSFFEFIRRSI